MVSLESRLEHVVVAGAGGKMGAGITLLLLQAMAKLEAEKYQSIGSGKFQLIAIEASIKALYSLKNYLRKEMQKWAEKQIIFLRKIFSKRQDLVSNEQVINATVEGALDLVRFAITPYEAKGAKLIFEAISEEPTAKITLLQALKNEAALDALCCSNTSSIPIAFLAEASGWKNNLIGFHFYNPPLLQRIVEVVLLEKDTQINEFVQALAKLLGKEIVYSGDIPGFIGNGYLMREIAFSCEMVKELKKKYSLPEAIYLVNLLTQELLVRPMGIFQLADYVGIDICCHIAELMSTHLKEPKLPQAMLLSLLAKNIKGGHDAKGQQKEGFFRYQAQKIVAAINPDTGEYIPIENEASKKIFFEYFEKPIDLQWKSMPKNKQQRLELLHSHFFNLSHQEKSPAATFVRSYLTHLVEIEKTLLKQGVIASSKDFERVLKEGFGHMYTPLEMGFNSSNGNVDVE